MAKTMTVHEVIDADLPDWRFLLGALHARFRSADYPAGVQLLARIGEAAEEQNHHPDLDLRYGHLDVRLVSHDVGGVTDRDVRLARTISELAASVGAQPAPDEVQTLEFALDTPDFEQIAPFWAAIFGREHQTGSDEIVDPSGASPAVWFQRSEPTATVPAQRWHVDVSVPLDRAQERIDAALAAGGTLVSSRAAPAFWILSDAQGNLACVCTPMGRDKPSED